MSFKEPKLTPVCTWGNCDTYSGTFTTPNASQTAICVVKATTKSHEAPTEFSVEYDVSAPAHYRALPDSYFISRAAAEFSRLHEMTRR
ncbi:hypothetical protein [Capsulimonas corticalis]|uniref:hypothetical protein n=1 Tax=Capsulimonas corticalis TaxID=2219043 RepID=UPI000F651C70|nr:hypothetical protein [Capsulimonas corticalis]